MRGRGVGCEPTAVPLGSAPIRGALVLVAITPYDLAKGRITYRFKSSAFAGPFGRAARHWLLRTETS